MVDCTPLPKPEKKPKKKKASKEFKEPCLKYCQICGKRGRIQRHHIRYRSQGGTNNPKNRIDICDDCNFKVHSRLPGYLPKDLYWYVWIDKKRQRAAKVISGG